MYRMCYLTTYPFNELNGWNQIKTEVDEFPLDALALVLFLLQDEHVMVKKLLEFLICQVDAQLLKCVELIQEIGNIIRQKHLKSQASLLM